MKKLLSLALIFALTLSFAACGNNNSQNKETDSGVEQTTPVETEPVGTESAETEPTHTHEYVLSNTIDKTCTTDGSKTYTCSCGDTYTETEEATGHSYELTNSVDKTCTTDGSKTYTCSCGDTYTDTERATGHIWGDWTTVVEPTFTNNGQNRRACSVCSESETESIAMLVFNDTMAEEIASAVYWADVSMRSSASIYDDYASLSPELVARFVVDYLNRLNPSKIEQYCTFVDHGNWTELTECNIPMSVLEEYATIIFGYSYDFSSLAEGDNVKIERFGAVGAPLITREYKGYEALGNGTYVITIEVYARISFDTDEWYLRATDVNTVQYHSSGIWSILGCVQTLA